jgi:hypothetical protein
MGTLVAAAVYGPVAGAVTAYSAWGLYLAWKNRYFTTVKRAASGEPCHS